MNNQLLRFYDAYQKELFGLVMGVLAGQIYRYEPTAAVAFVTIFLYLTIINQNKYIILRDDE